MNKFIGSFIFCLLLSSCMNSGEPSGGQVSNEKDMLVYGQKIYESQCRLCHGEKGDAAFAGAKDLKQTQLNESSIGDLIYHGKGTMPAFKEILGEPEINAVSKYVVALKN